MRSPGSARSARVAIERVARAIALASLLGWIVLVALPARDAVVVTSDATLWASLPRWTRSAIPGLHARFDTTPDARTAAWLAALRDAGATVSWSGDALVPTALEAYRAPDPAGSAIVLASGGSDTLVIADALGPIDTLGGSAMLRLASLSGAVAMRAGAQTARVATPDTGSLKRILVVGMAGWEGKFLIAALEEAGWDVDARLSIAPGQDVVQGAGRSAPDTARHAAVVLLDSAAAQAIRGVEEFVRAGGGLVIIGSANRVARLASLRGWSARARDVAPLGTLPGDTLWRGNARVPLPLDEPGGAIVLEARSGAPTLVARRYRAGRVIGVGYDETWRWRMAGGPRSVAEHRAWWERIVSSVAMRPSTRSVARASASPVASLYDRLGAPRSQADHGVAFSRDVLANLLGALLLASLLVEWLLRRSRGAR